MAGRGTDWSRGRKNVVISPEIRESHRRDRSEELSWPLVILDSLSACLVNGTVIEKLKTEGFRMVLDFSWNKDQSHI
jgi:hypothetical protein